MLGRSFFSLVIFSAVACAQAKTCPELAKLVASTYTFKPSTLTKQQQSEKAKAMDAVWNSVKANQAALAPCFKAILDDPKVDSWLLFDGSQLLASISPTPETRALQVRAHIQVSLQDVALEVWVRNLTRLALDDLDISAAADRWMRDPKIKYFVPRHSLTVIHEMGAAFLYNSMSESMATPALIKIASDAAHPGREVAVRLLLDQVTPQAMSFLRSMDPSWMSSEARSELPKVLAKLPSFEPRSEPKTDRATYLRVFNALVAGDERPFLELAEKVPDGERDVVAVMTAEDVPLIRRVRRHIIAVANQHQLEMYPYFTLILYTMVKL